MTSSKEENWVAKGFLLSGRVGVAVEGGDVVGASVDVYGSTSIAMDASRDASPVAIVVRTSDTIAMLHILVTT